MLDVREAAVIGAGVMGAGIAAHLASAGVEVALLDVEASRADDAIARQFEAGGFAEPGNARLVTPGSVSDDLDRLARADWIIEAVAERPEVKRDLYRQIEAVRKDGSVVSSNTSTIQLAALMEGMPDRLAGDFVITHFFNPPQVMRLLEIVPGRRTRPGVAARIAAFAEGRLGKSVVACADTPGFIANRIGGFWMAAAVNEAVRLGIDIETADAAISAPFSLPKTGFFALADLVGIDVIALVWQSLHAALPASDPLRAYPVVPEIVAGLVAHGRLGRKAGGGFYRRNADGSAPDAIDLATGGYRPGHTAPALSSDARALMAADTAAGRYATAVMGRTLAYAVEVAPELAATPSAIDTAMRTGYGWTFGPVETIDRLGAVWLARHLAAYRLPVPSDLTRAAASGGFYASAVPDPTTPRAAS